MSCFTLLMGEWVS